MSKTLAPDATEELFFFFFQILLSNRVNHNTIPQRSNNTKINVNVINNLYNNYNVLFIV